MTDPLLIDSHGGMTSTFQDQGEGFVVKTSQDVTPYLDKNRKLQNEGVHQTKDRSMRFVASIPDIITLKWLEEDGVYWPRLSKHERAKYLRRKLNDPDYSGFKIGPGKI